MHALTDEKQFLGEININGMNKANTFLKNESVDRYRY